MLNLPYMRRSRKRSIPDEERFRAMLSAKGLKATPQRLAVHGAMSALVHAGADEVYEWLIKSYGRKVSKSSVYKILTELADCGIFHYRLSYGNRLFFDVCNFPHAHIFDRKNEVFKDLADEELSEMVNGYLKSRHFRGFKLEDVEIEIICRPSRRGK